MRHFTLTASLIARVGLIAMMGFTQFSTAFATILSGNDPSIAALPGHVATGPGNVTVDSLTGLAWLDVTLSVGLSYNDVIANLAPQGAFSGYRLATNAEVFGFWSDAGIPVPFAGEGHPGIGTVQSLWGVTSHIGFSDTYVFTSTPYAPNPAQASVMEMTVRPSDSYDYARVSGFGVRLDQPNADIAAALVRTSIPKPVDIVISANDPQVVPFAGKFVTGPGNTTIDTLTGLAWIDTSLTRGLTREIIAAQLGPGGAFPGYRIATNAEVTTLWRHSGITTPNNGNSEDTRSIDFLQRLTGYEVDFLGTGDRITCMATVDKTVAPPAFDIEQLINKWDSRGVNDIAGLLLTNSACSSASNQSIALVKKVPEPSTLALAAFGVLGLLIAARRKR